MDVFEIGKKLHPSCYNFVIQSTNIFNKKIVPLRRNSFYLSGGRISLSGYIGALVLTQ